MDTFFNARSMRQAVAIMLCATYGYGAPPAPATAAPAAPSQAQNPEQQMSVQKKQLTKEELLAPEFLSKLAQTYGHMVAKSLDNPVVKLNVDDVLKGMQEAKEGKAAPLTQKEYEQAMQLLQKVAHETMAKKQIEEASAFLKENATKEGVVQLEPGKLQYKILHEGTGDAVVTKDTLPKINYNITLLDGTSLGSSEHGGPVDLDLDDTMPGLKEGVMGMKQGEKRRLFIHPDLAYGGASTGHGLIIFDVEVVSLAPKPVKTAQNEADGALVADNEDDEDDEDDEDLFADDDEDDDDDIDDYDDEEGSDSDFDSEKIAKIIASLEDEDDDGSDDDDTEE
jgi:peptidylprolyl isomerase